MAFFNGIELPNEDGFYEVEEELCECTSTITEDYGDFDVEGILAIFKHNEYGPKNNKSNEVIDYTFGTASDETGTYDTLIVECDNSNPTYLGMLKDDLHKYCDAHNLGYDVEGNDNGFYGRTYTFYEMLPDNSELNESIDKAYCVYGIMDDKLGCFDTEEEAIDFAINNNGDYIIGPVPGIPDEFGQVIWRLSEYDDEEECDWCGERFASSYLMNTDSGRICGDCYAAIRSHGEPVTIYNEDFEI